MPYFFQPLPQNIFIIAACNPHRANSIASRANSDPEHQQNQNQRASQDSYYVRCLHPTLEIIKWDFGALDEYQENQYISAKLESTRNNIYAEDIPDLTQLIVGSQKQMRNFAKERIRSCGWSEEETELRSKSCVSQRDIQRVFIFYKYLLKLYTDEKIAESRSKELCTDLHRRAILVSLGLVYYLRLSTKDREIYKKWLDAENSMIMAKLKFSEAFKDDLDWLTDLVELPTGIAKTEALKENIFTTILCCVTKIPLIIEGAPGSSKTLSFNLVVGNIKGKESIRSIFRNSDVFPHLTPFFYQCSRRTTSVEIETVFKRAINKQESQSVNQYPIQCVVCMDEAGLPERTHESLKVLHYYLDKPKVSFVAITNDPLDASKTNRAINLYRSSTSEKDLRVLAKDCLNLEDITCDVKIFCSAYWEIMKRKIFSDFFGLRDFIYFLIYLRNHVRNGRLSDEKLILSALERNFGGMNEEGFNELCSCFIEAVSYCLWIVKSRGSWFGIVMLLLVVIPGQNFRVTYLSLLLYLSTRIQGYVYKFKSKTCNR